LGLAEMHFVNDFDNITNDNGFILKLSDGEETFTVESSLEAGQYSKIGDVIEAFNHSMLQSTSITMDFSKYIKDSERAIYFTNDRFTGHVRLVNNHPALSIILKGDLAHCFGFLDGKTYRKSQKAPNIADIDAGFHSLYVYTDVIEPQLVGDSVVPLLRVVDFSKRSSGNVTVIFKSPYFMPLIRNTIDNVEINIRRDDGRLATFRRGKSVIVLCFRKDEE
jgi:hypothetical protein